MRIIDNQILQATANSIPEAFIGYPASRVRLYQSNIHTTGVIYYTRTTSTHLFRWVKRKFKLDGIEIIFGDEYFVKKG